MNQLNTNDLSKQNSLLNLLRKGGYILYARHGEATVGKDQPYLNFQDCSTQRNLSVAGKQQAIRYGQLLRKLQIPLSTPVISSSFCRTIETANLAFGMEHVWVDPFWININRLSENPSKEEQKGTLTTLNLILERPPLPGTNQVIIAHGFPEGVGLGKIPYMGTVIVKPFGEGKGYEVLGKFTLNDMMNLR